MLSARATLQAEYEKLHKAVLAFVREDAVCRRLMTVRPRPKRSAMGGIRYEYTPFCNGPGDVKSPRDRHAAELTLLSVVGAEAATLCCQKER
jgi:hypothetical protein